MSEPQETINPDETGYELQKREEINRKGRAYSHSRGDAYELRTGVFEWEMVNDKSRFSLGVCNMIGVEQSHTVRGLFSIFQYVPPEEWQKVQDAFTRTAQHNIPLDVRCCAIRSDGVRIAVRITGKVTINDEGNPMIEGEIEDVTDPQG